MSALGHVFWIARHGHTDAGFISAYKEGDTTWIKKLYILPEKQGLGIGKAGFVVDKEVPVRMGPFEFTDYVMTKAL